MNLDFSGIDRLSTTEHSDPKQPLEQGSRILQRQADNNAEQLETRQ